MLLLAGFSLAVASRPALMNQWVRRLLWVGVVATSIRALIGAVGDLQLLLTGGLPTTVTLVADLWFVVAAVLMFSLLRTHDDLFRHTVIGAVRGSAFG